MEPTDTTDDLIVTIAEDIYANSPVTERDDAGTLLSQLMDLIYGKDE